MSAVPNNRAIWIVGAFLALSLFWWVDELTGPRGPDNTQLILGTWTDPKGEPENSIRIHFVKSPTPDVIGVSAYDGKMSIRRYFGAEQLEATWNYGSSRPLILNIVGVPGVRFAAVRAVDEDHISVVFEDDVEVFSRSDVFEHGDVKSFVRIGKERWPAP